MASLDIPIGEPESQTLEFKARDALNKPATIAREVVGMLNAPSPGVVWVGLREENSNAMAVETIEDAATAKSALWDHLVEVIEPSPHSDEVDIELIGNDEFGFILRIHASGKRRPYAQLRSGGRHYLIRVGARLRPMTREEILSAASEGQDVAPTEREDEQRRLVQLRNDLPTKSIWMATVPIPTLAALDVQDDYLKQLMTDPSVSGNRRDGWSVVHSYGQERQLAQDSVTTATGARRFLRVDDKGRVYAQAPLETLFHGGEGTDIYPYALMEQPVSILRLTSHLLDRFADEKPRQVLCDIAFLGIQGWKLKPYSPRSAGWERSAHNQQHVFETGDDLVREKPFEFDSAVLRSNPDECAYAIVRWIYQSFGFEEDKIPFEFDRESKRLLIE